MRIIDADELVEYLKKHHSMSQGVISDVEHFPTAHMAIEALEKQATSGWNPIMRNDEGHFHNLPKEEEYVLLSSDGYLSVDFLTNDRNGYYWWEHIEPLEVGQAWMPLPEPYKEED